MAETERSGETREAADFLRRLSHVDRDILVWIRSVLSERDSLRAALSATPPDTDPVGLPTDVEALQAARKLLVGFILNEVVTTDEKRAALHSAAATLYEAAIQESRAGGGLDAGKLEMAMEYAKNSRDRTRETYFQAVAREYAAYAKDTGSS